MDKNRRNKKHSNWNNQKNANQQNNKPVEQKQKVFQFNHTNYEDENAKRERLKAIQELKAREVICPKCGLPINDMATAMTDKNSNVPVHFDCILSEIEKNETLGPNEKIAYIGQGRFGVLYYENMRDQRHFQIKKIIEWENKENTIEWRDEISSLYSKID